MALPLAQGGDIPQHTGANLQNGAGSLGKTKAGLGQDKRAFPHKQGGPHLLFQLLDALAQGLLGDEQLSRRGRKAAGALNLQKIFQCQKVHTGSPSFRFIDSL